VYKYQSVKNDEEVIEKLLALSTKLPTRGFDEYYNRIRANGHKWNRKRVLRIYRMLKLQLRSKKKRRLPNRTPAPLAQPKRPNEMWSMDFMSDSLENGRRFRVLNIIDDYNREAIWVDAQYNYPGEMVKRALEILELERGLPENIRVDNGPEFTCRTTGCYLKEKATELKFCQPGKPTQNAYIERFNRLYREDVLDAYLFSGIEQVRIISDQWKEDYNVNHPHKSLGKLSPYQFKILNHKGNNSFESVKAKMNADTKDLVQVSSPALTDSSELLKDVYEDIKPELLT
jgi:putative transposase